MRPGRSVLELSSRSSYRGADILDRGYDLSLNRYREIVHDETGQRVPLEIIADIEALEDDIAKSLAELKALLS
jgi:type I restriction enzyme M protein